MLLKGRAQVETSSSVEICKKQTGNAATTALLMMNSTCIVRTSCEGNFRNFK
jgi:hypothetical protein